jgi:hypothetical protein
MRMVCIAPVPPGLFFTNFEVREGLTFTVLNYPYYKKTLKKRDNTTRM